MTEAKLLAELMLQLSIYFESDTDDVAEWLTTRNQGLSGYSPIFLIKNKHYKRLHRFVMENMA